MRYFTLLCMLMLSKGIIAQTDVRDGRHVFNYDVTLTSCNFDGSSSQSTFTERFAAETKFVVRNIVGNDYIIQVLEYVGSQPEVVQLNQRLVGNAAGDIFFRLAQRETQNSYDLNAERLENRGTFTVGAATTLIKIRPGQKELKDGYRIYSEIGNDFNIGASAGFKFNPYRRLELSHSLVVGLSFTSIKVTPYTTQNFLQAESSQACVTFSWGYVFEYDRFQVSFFSGWDVMSGEVGSHWIYTGRPWLGLGFGYQIFRAQGEAANRID